MAFWSAERLSEELQQRKLISPFDPKWIDCASYTLHVGGQAFVTHDKFGDSGPDEPIVKVFGPPPGHTLRIPPGQFAFLLTQEDVHVPNTAIALISIKAKYKFRGLMNVSGFHVDPGWQGKLLFSVYNAGASEIIIQNEQPFFVIVYADLDRPTAQFYKGAAKYRQEITPDEISPLTLQVFSPLMLQRQVKELQEEIVDLRQSTATIKTVAVVLSTAVLVLFGALALWFAAAPSTLGAILAQTIKAAGYEMKISQEGVGAPSRSPEGASLGVQKAPSPGATVVEPTTPSKK